MVIGVDGKCVQGLESREVIAFQPADLSKAYVLNEKRNLGGDSVEYLFAAERARFIYIYPQNNKSCFAEEKILSIRALVTSF